MRHDERGAFTHHAAQPSKNLFLGVGVDRRQRVVENQNRRIGGDGARQRRPLLLPSRERDAALPDHGVVALREVGQVLVEPCDGCRTFDLRLPLAAPGIGARSGRQHVAARGEALGVEAEGDVVADRVREEERLLRHEADRATQRLQRPVAYVAPIHKYGAPRRLVQARDQPDQRRLPSAGLADDGRGLTGRNAHGDVTEDRRVTEGERQVPKFDGADNLVRLRTSSSGVTVRLKPDTTAAGINVVADGGRRIENVEHPLPARHAALQHVRHPAKRNHRPREHGEIGEEGDELAQRDALRDDGTAAEPQHQHRTQPEEERHGREEDPLQRDELPVAAHVLEVGLPEAFEFRALLAVGTHHAHARQRLLSNGAHLGELRLDALEPLVDGAAEVVHRDRDERQRDERQQRQPHVDGEHHRQRRDEGQQRIGGVHDRWPDHHPHGVEVVGGARHQVAGAVRLVVRQWQRLQMREELVAHVVLDVA